VPALPSSILEPLWVQFAALLPARQVHHPLGRHRRRIPDRIIFDKLIQVLVFGCGYRRIADHTCSASTLRRRRDEWITLGVAERLRLAVLGAYQRLFGWSWSTWRWTGASPRRPAAASSPGPARWTVASKASNAPSSLTLVASRWGWWLPRPTAAMMGCWPRPWTPSRRLGCCPSGQWCTWTPATTTRPAGRRWPNGA
jgi:transposase